MIFYIATVVLLGIAALFSAVIGEISPWWGSLIFIGYYFTYAFLQIFFALVVAALSKKDKAPKIGGFHYRVLYQTIFLLLRLTHVFYHVEGRNLLPKKGSTFLLVSNHLSHFDPMVIAMALPEYPHVSVTKPENFDVPIVGTLARRAGFIGINRTNPLAAMSAIRTAAELMSSGKCPVSVYPEGTISRGWGLAGFHDGVFLSAKKARVPVVVMTLLGTDKIKHNWYRKFTCVKLKIEGVIDSDEVAATPTAELSIKAREMMRPTLISAGLIAPPSGEAEVKDLSKIAVSK